MSEVESWLQQHIPAEGTLALDIGANVGEWSALLADRFDDVHAFEPNPQAHNDLRRRLADRWNATIVEYAVGDRCGDIELILFSRSVHASAHTIELAADAGGVPRGEVGQPVSAVTVPVVSLDTLGYAERPVDFVKIDTEGSEPDVLAGARLTLAANRPTLIVEIHALPHIDICHGLLASAGYQNVERLPHPHQGVHPGHCWLIAKAAA